MRECVRLASLPMLASLLVAATAASHFEEPRPSSRVVAEALGRYWRQVGDALADGTAEQRDLLLEGDILARPPVSLRNAEADPAARWPGRRVALALAPGEWPAEARRRLARALADMQRETCVRFVRRYDEPDYLLLRHVGNSCASVVGFLAGAGGVPVFLGGPGCLRAGTVQHEMLHSLGLWHEHTRPDRDQHVTVRWDRIAPGKQRNFYKRPAGSVLTLGLPYDYGSVMHYRAAAFSRDGRPTLEPRQKEAVAVMGQRVRFSNLDMAKLNTLYGCPRSYDGKEGFDLDENLLALLVPATEHRGSDFAGEQGESKVL